jgi:hypothetical protein
MSSNRKTTIPSVIGIDIGKNSFHLWARTNTARSYCARSGHVARWNQVEARLASLNLADPAVRLNLTETDESRKAAAFRSVLFSNLQENAARGEIEAGTAQFIDGLLGSGACGSLTSQMQQIFLQNVQTALVSDPLPLTPDEELRQFDFPILTITGEYSPPSYRLICAEMRKREPSTANSDPRREPRDELRKSSGL